MEEIILFDKLPLEIRERLIKNKTAWLSASESPEGSKWFFKKSHLDDLFYIPSITPNDKDEEELINKYKKECLELRRCIQLIVWPEMGILIDGSHHLTAFREAIEEDKTLSKIIECWELVNLF